MDLTSLTPSVLVKQINRSNSSRDGFYSVHQRPSAAVTPVRPDYDSDQPDTELTLPILNYASWRLTYCCWSGTWFESVSVLEQLEEMACTLSVCHFYICSSASFNSVCKNETTSLENIM